MIDLDPADAATAHALSVTRAELSPSAADKARLRAALGLPPATPPSRGAAAHEVPADGRVATPALRGTPHATRWWGGGQGVT